MIKKILSLSLIGASCMSAPITGCISAADHVFDRRPEFWIINGVHIYKDSDRIKLKKDQKIIDFQIALLNYIKAQKIDLDLKVTNLVLNIKNSSNDERNDINTEPLINMVHYNYFPYTDEQIEFLKRCTILKVLDVSEKKYNNQEYINDWNKNHPEELKEHESKFMCRHIKLELINKENIIVNYEIDLGNDISILFDYADN